MSNKEIYLAGSSFWGGKAFLEALPGVEEVIQGTTDFNTDITVSNIWEAYPSSNYLGATEVLKVTYDPSEIGLPLLLEAFFTTVDPHSIAKQINYSAPLPEPKIYFTDSADETIIDTQIAKLQQESSTPITIECLPLKDFKPVGAYAEDYISRNLGEDKVIDPASAEAFVQAHIAEFGM